MSVKASIFRKLLYCTQTKLVLTAFSRFPMLTRLLFSYYKNMAAISRSSHLHLCRLTIWCALISIRPKSSLLN